MKRSCVCTVDRQEDDVTCGRSSEGLVSVTTPPSQCSTSKVSVSCDRAVAERRHEMSSTSAYQHSASRRHPSYLSAVCRGDASTTARPRTSPDVRFDRRAIYSIAENEEYEQYPQKSSSGDHSAIHQPCAAESGMADNGRAGDQCDGGGWTVGGADLRDWCNKSAAGGDAADVGTYIRRDDVRKLLELRRQKTSAAPASNSSSQSSSGLPQRPVVGHRHDSTAVQTRGYDPGSAAMDPVSAASRSGFPAVCRPDASSLAASRPNSDAVDSMSVGSHKDSGYRSEDDRHGGNRSADSPTLSASNSAASLSSYSNRVSGTDESRRPDVKSLCSSFESLCSVQSGLSLPAVAEARRRPACRLESASSATRMRHVAESLYERSTSRPQQPLNAAHGAAVNTKVRRGSSSWQDDELSSRPVSARQTPMSKCAGSAAERGILGGNVWHSASVPAINRINESDPTMGFLDRQGRRTAASHANRCPGSVVAPPTGQSAYHRHNVDQSNVAADRRVRGRGYFRDNGGHVPSLRQPSASSASSSDRRSQPRQIPGLPVSRPAWK